MKSLDDLWAEYNDAVADYLGIRRTVEPTRIREHARRAIEERIAAEVLRPWRAAVERAEDAMSAEHNHCDAEGRCFDPDHAAARNRLRALLASTEGEK